MDQKSIITFLSTQSNIFEILRENRFQLAKEFYGVKKISFPSKVEITEMGIPRINTLDASQYHLQQMILESDPLAYMKNCMEENNEA